MSVKTLYLMRHAKSDWDDPNMSDHDRPLAPRGRRAAPVMADALRGLAIVPDLILCSTAVRARQTLEIVYPGLGSAPLRMEPSAYTFEYLALLTLIAQIDNSADSVMLVGHNPALQDLALYLCAPAQSLPSAQAEMVDKISRKYPTAAFTAIQFAGPWEEVVERKGTGIPLHFLKPKDFSALR